MSDFDDTILASFVLLDNVFYSVEEEIFQPSKKEKKDFQSLE